MEFEQAKVLGGVGGILCLLSMVSGVIGIVGIILLMIAFKSMADYYGRESIFKNALLALILEIVAVGVLLAFVGVTSLALLRAPPRGFHPRAFHVSLPLISIIAGAALIFVFSVVSAVFFRRALDELGEVSGEGLFKTAGLLYLVGAVLTIVFVGMIVIWIAFLLIGIAFFTMKPRAT